MGNGINTGGGTGCIEPGSQDIERGGIEPVRWQDETEHGGNLKPTGI